MISQTVLYLCLTYTYLYIKVNTVLSTLFITITNNSGIVVGQLACLIHEKMEVTDTNPLSKKIGNLLGLGTSLWWYHGPIIRTRHGIRM